MYVQFYARLAVISLTVTRPSCIAVLRDRCVVGRAVCLGNIKVNIIIIIIVLTLSLTEDSITL